jgi:phosphonate transport system ATP-binding protein
MRAPSHKLHERAVVVTRPSGRVTAVMPTSISPVVKLDEVSKSFGGTRALDRVSVTVHPGEFVAVIGRSGAGKTTLLRCLSRAAVATEGQIRFGNDDLATLRGRALRAHRARIGMIYQQFNLVRRLRVMDNVLVGRLPHVRGWRSWGTLVRRFPAADREAARRALAHVGLLARAWQRTDTLSGGEQQRVAIAKILAQAPAIILGDEPVASLDVANGAMVMDTLRRVASESGVTVITTLHHVDYARRYADRVLGFREGALVFDGTPAALDEAALSRIFGGGAPAPEALVAEPLPAGELAAV